MNFDWHPFTELLSAIVDNRGKTCPVGNAGIPLIATNCINSSNLYPSYDTTRYVSDETYKTWFRGHPKPGDILFVCKGSPGRTNWVPDPVDFCIAQDMVAVRADPRKIYPKYLLAALRSSIVQSQIDNMHVGTMIPHFKKGDFDKLKIPVPVKADQLTIGDFYFTVSERITLLRETNATLEAIAQALFKSWFVDFDPVRANAEAAAQGCASVAKGMTPPATAAQGNANAAESSTPFPPLDPATAALFPTRLTDSPLGLIPEGWQVASFTETVNVIGGGTPKTSIEEYWGGDIPWYSVVDAPAVSDVFVIDTDKHITEAGLKNSSTKLLARGTTIISARGTVGKLALVGLDMAMNQSCYGLQGKAGDAYFTYFSTYRLIETLKQRTHGSVFDTITRDTLSGVSVIYPTKSVIHAFEELLAPIMERVKENLKQAKCLATLRDTLLPRLISGQLRIPDAPTLADEVA